jgi:peroxiredoxin Q/BCP
MKQAPDFSLPDQDGTIKTLADFRGSWLVLYFYPKDDTPGCTKEACSFRDGFKDFADRGVTVVGVSKDSPKAHRKFADKYGLTFTLLADESKEVQKAYGAWTERGFMGRPGTLRNTYLIDPEGNIVQEYVKVKPELHVAQILADIDARGIRP